MKQKKILEIVKYNLFKDGVVVDQEVFDNIVKPARICIKLCGDTPKEREYVKTLVKSPLDKAAFKLQQNDDGEVFVVGNYKGTIIQVDCEIMSDGNEEKVHDKNDTFVMNVDSLEEKDIDFIKSRVENFGSFKVVANLTSMDTAKEKIEKLIPLGCYVSLDPDNKENMSVDELMDVNDFLNSERDKYLNILPRNVASEYKKRIYGTINASSTNNVLNTCYGQELDIMEK